jgi:hypothetical protein
MIFLKIYVSINSYTPGDRAFSIAVCIEWVALGKELGLIALFYNFFLKALRLINLFESFGF